jgi:hypothetical protein
VRGRYGEVGGRLGYHPERPSRHMAPGLREKSPDGAAEHYVLGERDATVNP